MEITIWGDFACPFCYLGETQLEKVIKDLGKEKDVRIRFKAYQLDPEAPLVPVETMTEHFMAAHEQSEEEARKQMDQVERMASRAGLKYNLAGVQVCSTFDAHRLMKYAQATASYETVLRLNFALFRANFVENLRLSDREVLADIAASVGIKHDEAESILNSEAYAEEVKADVAALNGREDFEYVPYMVFEGGQVLQGVVSPGALKKALA